MNGFGYVGCTFFQAVRDPFTDLCLQCSWHLLFIRDSSYGLVSFRFQFPVCILSMVGHLFQNYDTIYVRFFPTYTCNHSCYTIYVRFFATYTWVLSYKRAYICAQKSPYICVRNKHVVYGVTETRRIRGTELYRQQKNPFMYDGAEK